MFNFIFNGSYLQLLFLLIFFLLLILFFKGYKNTTSKKDQSLIGLKNRRDQILYLGTCTLFVTILVYLIELFSWGKNSLFFGSNPFLLVILRTDSAEQSSILEEILSGMIQGSTSVLTGLSVVMIAALFWKILQIKINKTTFNN